MVYFGPKSYYNIRHTKADLEVTVRDSLRLCGFLFFVFLTALYKTS